MTVVRSGRCGLILAALATMLAACTTGGSGEEEGSSLDGPADVVLHEGAVYTVNPAQPWAEAVAVRDGRITAVGSNELIADQIGPETQVVDLSEQLLLPGFQDDHIHIQEASSTAFTCFLRRGTPPEQLSSTMSRCRPGPGDWVLGWGFSIDNLIKQVRRGQRTPLEIIDEAIPDHPAAMMEETSHSVWANSLALDLAGITSDSPNPTGGVIARDKSGAPNGLLLDSAGEAVFDAALNRTDELVDVQYEGLQWGLRQLAKNGITSVADARVYWKRADLEVWQLAESKGTLTTRATLGLWAYPDEGDARQIAKLISLYDPNPDGLVHVNEVKLYSDGITLNGTAAMLRPYERGFLIYIKPLGVKSRNGLNYFDETRLTRYVTELERAGFDMHIHVLGDRGAHEALNAIESAIDANGSIDRRHRLTHVELVDASDIPRFAELGVGADAQVSGEWTTPEAWSDNRPMVGDRANNFIPLRSLYDAGARVSLSSDWDVSSMNPLVGIEHSLTRDPQSLPNLETAIAAYSIVPAFNMRQEDTTGSVEVGKFADLVVLDRNLFEIAPDKISEVSVVSTWFAGEQIY